MTMKIQLMMNEACMAKDLAADQIAHHHDNRMSHRDKLSRHLKRRHSIGRMISREMAIAKEAE